MFSPLCNDFDWKWKGKRSDRKFTNDSGQESWEDRLGMD